MQNVKNLSDEQLVVFIRTKEKEAFSEVVDRYEGKLLRYATYLINDKDRAADVVQESFIKTFVNLNGFNEKKKFSSWIYRIVHNESLNIIKKYKKEIPMIEDFDVKGDTDLEKELDEKLVKQMVRDCLNKMDIKYAESLELFYLEEKSYEEISDILRLPMGTVAVRINRAKALMKNICQKNK